MEKLFLLVLVCGIFPTAFSQQQPAEPCCSIISKDMTKNIAIIRDNTTGRLYQLKPDAMDMKALSLNDVVNITSGKVTSIGGATKTYVTARMDPGEPCCNIISIQPDPLEPCCNAVSIRNNTTNNVFKISVPKQIAATLKAGNPVYVEPINDIRINNAEHVNAFAVVQSSYGGGKNSYGYPMSSLNDNKNDAEPCCNILSINSTSGITIARDKTTGRLYQFNADAMDRKALKLNDAVKVSAGKVTSIGGAARTYVTARMDPQEPCCGIVSIQPDPAQPCCNIVSYTSNSSRAMSRFRAPKNISRTFKVGQPVYAAPINDMQINNLDPVNGMQINNIEPITEFAIVESAYSANNGQMASYGYPATSAEEASNGNATDKWVITNVASMKGVLGRLDMHFPAGVDWNIWIYSGDKMINSFYQSHNTNSYGLSPGEYRLLLGNVPVENVPIQKGHETRLKAGFLNVVSDGGWELYDETKTTIYTTNTMKQKIALPVGTYQLQLGGNYYPVVIKDGKTEEF